MRTRTSVLSDQAIAAICHEVNRRYCISLGDESQPTWENAPAWATESAYQGVLAIMEGRTIKPEDSHASWFRHKQAEGWVYGPVKDPEKKEHPCMVPYDQLPTDQQVKDALFLSTVLALSVPLAGAPVVAAPEEPVAQELDPLIGMLNEARGGIKSAAVDVASLRQMLARNHFAARPSEDTGETIANVTLAYRHLEDASMRLGKAIQARDGGVSVYDKATTVGA